MTKRCIYVFVAIFACPIHLLGQTPPLDTERIRTLEEQLLSAQNNLAQLQNTIAGLVLEVTAIKNIDVSLGHRLYPDSGGASVLWLRSAVDRCSVP